MLGYSNWQKDWVCFDNTANSPLNSEPPYLSYSLTLQALWCDDLQKLVYCFSPSGTSGCTTARNTAIASPSTPCGTWWTTRCWTPTNRTCGTNRQVRNLSGLWQVDEQLTINLFLTNWLGFFLLHLWTKNFYFIYNSVSNNVHYYIY